MDTWHPLPYLNNGWTDYGGEYARGAYTITEDGWVRLRGLVRGTSGDAAICQLPAGYRPVATHVFSQFTAGARSARVDVRVSGHVTGAYNDLLPNPAYLSLDGISFATY